VTLAGPSTTGTISEHWPGSRHDPSVTAVVTYLSSASDEVWVLGVRAMGDRDLTVTVKQASLGAD
jgi:hypothetical protein